MAISNVFLRENDIGEITWNRLENEPSLWYERFLVYLQLPQPRTLTAAIREWAKSQPSMRRSKERGESGHPPYLLPSWKVAAEKYKWVERAEAYDRWRFQQLEKIRRHAIISISSLVDEAVSTLRSLLSSPDDRVRLDTVRFIFDKIGLHTQMHIKLDSDYMTLADAQLIQIILQDADLLKSLVKTDQRLLEDNESDK